MWGQDQAWDWTVSFQGGCCWKLLFVKIAPGPPMDLNCPSASQASECHHPSAWSRIPITCLLSLQQQNRMTWCRQTDFFPQCVYGFLRIRPFSEFIFTTLGVLMLAFTPRPLLVLAGVASSGRS